AIYHSHPGDNQQRTLSFSDLALSRQFRLPILLWHEEAGWDYFDPLGASPYPLRVPSGEPDQLDYYTGWGWEWGRVDCGNLIYRYYQGMHGIELQGPEVSEHGKEILAKGWDKYRESLIANGFVQANDLLPQANDLLLMNLRSPHGNLHHAAVMVDGQNLLHITEPGDYSHIELFHSELRQKTHSIWRHPQFL
ncbi:MAG: hypothetical protein ACRC2U_19605, partial [Aeromonas sp.]